jgi:hypothetical protein
MAHDPAAAPHPDVRMGSESRKTHEFVLVLMVALDVSGVAGAFGPG